MAALAVAFAALTLGAGTATGQGLVQQGEKLVGQGAFEASFGRAVALSANGDTALIGEPFNNNYLTGAAWVFTRSGSSWIQQGGALRPGASTFGTSVALSADGNTALISAPAMGAVYVYVRTGTTWTQQAALAEGISSFGSSVALSADGNTALIGIIGAAAVVYGRSSSGWTEEATLTGTEHEGEGEFGRTVALSSDGETALVGAPTDNHSVGAAWVFARSGGTWTQQGPKLVGDGEQGEAEFGQSVALAPEGNYALIGAPSQNRGGFPETLRVGAAWVFARSGTAWNQQTQFLLQGEEEAQEGEFGKSVALSPDGTYALIGGPHESNNSGAAWLFTRSGESWVQQQTVTGRGEEEYPYTGLGGSVAISADGSTAVIGGPGYNHSFGAAWMFSYIAPGPAPAVKKLSAKKGAAAGGTEVTITGTNFVGVTAVKFGTTAATSFAVNSETSIIATSPAGTTGTVEVTVTTPNGESGSTSKDHFKYGIPTVTAVNPSAGSKAGGTQVVVTGSGFALGADTSFRFGRGIGAAVNCGSTTECTMIAPAAAKTATVEVRATASNKTSKKSAADRFSYD
jgi:IPT/TIG domain/FG-GAP repeat